MEFLWNSYGTTREQHASSRLSVQGRDGDARPPPCCNGVVTME
jgi:hypothetical protein